MRKIGSLLLALLLLASFMTACASSQAGTFEGRKKEIEKSWLNKEDSELIWYTEDDPDTANSGMRYYGTYNGYDILYCPVSFMQPGYVVIGDELFLGRSDFRLYGYQDGTFRALAYLYRDGLIIDEQITEIAETHREYEESMQT